MILNKKFKQHRTVLLIAFACLDPAPSWILILVAEIIKVINSRN